MAHPAITQVQSAFGENGTGGTSVAATWVSATDAGSTLIAAVIYNSNGSLVTVSPPSGWVEVNSGGDGTSVGGHTYWVPGTGSPRSGTETFSLSGSRKAVVILVELSGPAPEEGGGSGAIFGGPVTDTSPTCVGSIYTAYPNGFAFFWVGNRNVTTYTSPLPTGFNFVTNGGANQVSSSGGGAGGTKVTGAMMWAELTNGPGEDYAAHCTISASQIWFIQGYEIGRKPPFQATLGVGW